VVLDLLSSRNQGHVHDRLVTGILLAVLRHCDQTRDDLTGLGISRYGGSFEDCFETSNVGLRLRKVLTEGSTQLGRICLVPSQATPQ
jgi:hypothetical protein